MRCRPTIRDGHRSQSSDSITIIKMMPWWNIRFEACRKEEKRFFAYSSSEATLHEVRTYAQFIQKLNWKSNGWVDGGLDWNTVNLYLYILYGGSDRRWTTNYDCEKISSSVMLTIWPNVKWRFFVHVALQLLVFKTLVFLPNVSLLL